MHRERKKHDKRWVLLYPARVILFSFLFTGGFEEMAFPKDSSASALRANRRLEALDSIPAPTSPRRLECDRVSCNHQ